MNQINKNNKKNLKKVSTALFVFMMVFTNLIPALFVTAQEVNDGNDDGALNLSNDINNQSQICVYPDNLGYDSVEIIGTSFGPDELTLQEMINIAGYTNDPVSEQKQYQVWNFGNNTTQIEIELINQATGNGNTFGYYLDQDPDNFIPLFRTNENPSSYPEAPLFINGQKITLTIPANAKVDFAIDANPGQANNGIIRQYSTVIPKNPDYLDHVLAFDAKNDIGILSQKYLLAFEDLYGLGDLDYNDLLVSLKIISCQNEPPTNNLPTVSLSANPSTIDQGATSTLSWTSTNAVSCSASWTSSIETNGSFDVSPEGNTDYSITCTGPGGSSTSATTIFVNYLPPVPLVDLSADPQFITDGATTTISWNSTYTDSCSATWTLSTSTSGFEIVSPNITTTYSITCLGNGGSVSDEVIVTVNPKVVLPEVSISADPSNIIEGQSATISWNSKNAISCFATWTLATSTDGSQLVSPLATTDYAISCEGNYGTTTATTTVIVNPPADNDDDGNDSGGGGSGMGGRRRDISDLLAPQGEILGATSCSYLRDFLKIDWQNDPVEVLKIQSFLNQFEGENLSLTGVFDQSTFEAVSRFQEKYFDDILAPWGHDKSTGFVYILTKKKINEIYCNTVLSLSQSETDEISSFKNVLSGFDNTDNSSFDPEEVVGFGPKSDILAELATQTEGSFPIVELQTEANDGEENTKATSTSLIQNLAVSLFALPERIFGEGKYILPVIIVLVILAFLIRFFGLKGGANLSQSEVKSKTNGKSEELAKNKKDKENPVIVLPPKVSKETDLKSEEVYPDEEIIIEEDDTEGDIKEIK